MVRNLIAIIVLAAMAVFPSHSPLQAQPPVEQKTSSQANKEELKKEAALNLFRLKRSIEKDGFYNARIALNIWHSSALTAGTFDQALYDQLKVQLYEKAMADSLSCYQYFMQLKDYNNAKTCMLIWRSHAKEIDRYDPSGYQKLQEGLEDLKKK